MHTIHPGLTATPKYAQLHHRHDRTQDFMRRHCMPNPSSGNFFGGLDDFTQRAESLVDVVKNNQPMNIKQDMYPTHMNGSMPPPFSTSYTTRGIHSSVEHNDLLDQISLTNSLAEMQNPMLAHQQYSQIPNNGHMNSSTHVMLSHGMGMHDLDTDPRELEAFAERFKQRRIKLGVTQADVGRALANLKLPGVGALSQSTICRFESLTLSHNNMIALKPVLAEWLDQAEATAKAKRENPLMANGDKKRKRTSIAAPEKRSLEAYFTVQPRPSSEKIAAIAEKLELRKNVVRVWFCNQRQKQKRMKYSAQGR
ncbi:POU domain, class 4, transcription factor 3-like [Antedon mediterranea]|uniref:POU domain, class 4, transcription factor 3-like n=1 Tax=Antedon mediterranea TaxID=105859 RepID=UPI003AF8F967